LAMQRTAPIDKISIDRGSVLMGKGLRWTFMPNSS
jgi:hypothetical protein